MFITLVYTCITFYSMCSLVVRDAAHRPFRLARDGRWRLVSRRRCRCLMVSLEVLLLFFETVFDHFLNHFSTILGPFLGHVWQFFDHVGPCWTFFRTILDPFWTMFDHFWTIFGPLWPFFDHVGPCWTSFGPFWTLFGPCWTIVRSPSRSARAGRSHVSGSPPR